jgi:hypothetical protein
MIVETQRGRFDLLFDEKSPVLFDGASERPYIPPALKSIILIIGDLEGEVLRVLLLRGTL